MNTELDLFYLLKIKILERYKEFYPYYTGGIEQFGNKEIENLRDSVEEVTGQYISEKWVYTHLKPKGNNKLPRKDMLDILSKFSGYGNWEEFVFKHKNAEATPIKPKINRKYYLVAGVATALLVLGLFFYLKNKSTKKLTVINAYTKDTIKNDAIKVYKLEDSQKIAINMPNAGIAIDPSTKKIFIESPYYKAKEIEVQQIKNHSIELEPEDKALLLKNIIKNKEQAWQKKQQELQQLLAADVEVIVVLENNMGAEYYAKEEFIRFIIAPSLSSQKWELQQVQYDANNKVKFLRIIQ
jgi:predicted Fe-Mo cluster-binding NifX family protein